MPYFVENCLDLDSKPGDYVGKSGVYWLDLDGLQFGHGRTTVDGGSVTPALEGNGERPSALPSCLSSLLQCGHGLGTMEKPASRRGRIILFTRWHQGDQDHLLGLNPDTGKELWRADGVHRYVCPSVVAHKGVVYAIGGGHTSLAVRAGGRGDVTKTHTLWRKNRGSNVSSPIYHDGHIYWASDSGGVVVCQEAATGKVVYQERLTPPSGLIYASALLGDGKIYYVSQHKGTYVAAAPKFKLLAHNVFADDSSRTNATPAADGGQLLLRSDEYIYCIGKR
jgi:outer membrane protein assembly factor BamB